MRTLPERWRSSIPEHWAWTKLRHVAKVGTGHTPDRRKPEYWANCDIPWVTAADLSSRASAFQPLVDTEQKVSGLGVANSAAVVHPAGTVMLCRTASVGLFCITGIPMATTQAFVTWTPGDSLDQRYLLYLIAALRPEFDRLAYGSTHLTIYMPDLEAIEVPVPPVEEQVRIAAFLDEQVARVDAATTAKERQLHVLDSAIASIAHEGVSGFHVPGRRRDQGVPWAPSLPEAWPAAKLSTVARVGTGHTPSRNEPDYWRDCSIPWLTTGDVHRFRHDQIDSLDETELRISEVGIQNSSAVLHPAGTVALCRTAASAGFSVVMGVPMATSQDYATWTCGPMLDNSYLLWCLRAMRRDLLERLAMGSTHKTIYFPDLQSIRVPLPPLGDQRSIAVGILEAAETVRRSMRAVDRSISLLLEYKQALITEAVTGEFDVSTARTEVPV